MLSQMPEFLQDMQASASGFFMRACQVLNFLVFKNNISYMLLILVPNYIV